MRLLQQAPKPTIPLVEVLYSFHQGLFLGSQISHKQTKIPTYANIFFLAVNAKYCLKSCKFRFDTNFSIALVNCVSSLLLNKFKNLIYWIIQNRKCSSNLTQGLIKIHTEIKKRHETEYFVPMFFLNWNEKKKQKNQEKQKEKKKQISVIQRWPKLFETTS